MRYFFTDNFSKSYYIEALIKADVKNVLMSYASAMKAKDPAKQAMKILSMFDQEVEIMIDSGAFSAWNSGETIDRNELLAFYKTIKAAHPKAHFINLDVIPGAKGRKPTKKEAQIATEQSWQNYLWFKEQGIKTLPVFHEDDDWSYLYKMMDETDFICISPANDSSPKRRMMWLDKVYSILKADYKTHGLAATSAQLLKRYPFYSVDSINWKASSMYGRSALIKNIPQQHISAMARHKQGGKDRLLQLEIAEQHKLEAYITKLWSMRGVRWD